MKPTPRSKAATRQAPLRRPRARPVSAHRAPEATAQGTRERVLELARSMIRDRENAAISLVEVAAAAGLSRQALYLLFGNRAGLLMALVDHLDETSAAPARLQASLRERHESDFEPYVRAWFDYLPMVLPVARALSAAATSGDEDARMAWQSRLRKLRRGFRQITGQLESTGVLRRGWTADTAADWMLALTHVDLWQHLVIEAGWRPEDHVTRVLSTLRQTLVKE